MGIAVIQLMNQKRTNQPGAQLPATGSR